MAVPVSCNICRKAIATIMVKDNGLKTYPVCPGCRRQMIAVVSETAILTDEQIFDIQEIIREDMALARENEEIAIAETKLGTVFLRYDKIEQKYSCVAKGGRVVFGPCKAGDCLNRLFDVYRRV